MRKTCTVQIGYDEVCGKPAVDFVTAIPMGADFPLCAEHYDAFVEATREIVEPQRD